MAEIIVVGGKEYKKRSPWGAWGLTIITIGVYAFVWYYKINREARDYLEDESIKPVLAMLALFVPLLNIYSYYRTGERIVRVETKTGIQRTLEPVLAAVAGIIYFLIVPYAQGHLNLAWDAAATAAGPGLADAPPGVPPPPPAPQQ